MLTDTDKDKMMIGRELTVYETSRMSKENNLSWKEAYEKMREIAGEAIGLADAYAGGESENANTLNEQFEELTLAISLNPPKK